MNKTGFIKEISKQLNVSENEAILIENVFEEFPMIGKKNKQNIVNLLIERLNYSEEQADEIYNKVSNIAITEVKDKIRHPFKSKD